jgi:FkbM family methyltransferase
MRLEPLRTHFRQFPAGVATRLACAKVAQRLCDRLAIPSYSQTGEDRIIQAMLPEPTGFYVDVGSNDPVRFSNTFALYRRGWRGLVVDANEALIRRHRLVRPRDVCVHAAVSDREGTAEFTEFADPLVSSLDPDHVRSWSGRQRVVRRRQVRTERLTSILRAGGAPARFDLLSVDVEGHDLAVVASLDFDAYRPRLVVAEMHDFAIARAGAHPVVAHLAARGYDLAGYVVANGYFVDAAA